MFLRTASGLSNRARFTRSDFTLYVEGGGGIPAAGSSDVIFWGDVFRALRPDINCRIKASGGKPEVEKIAEKIASGEIENSFAAMDADFDHVLGNIISHRRVLYTFGYSWENDIYDFANLRSGIIRALKGATLPETELLKAEDDFQRLLQALTPWITADLWLRHLNSSLFPGISSGAFIQNLGPHGATEVKGDVLWRELKKRMRAIPKGTRTCRPRVYIIWPNAMVQGHVLKFLASTVVKQFCKTNGRRAVSDETLENALLLIFCRRIEESGDVISDYYRRQFSNLY